MPPKIEPIIKGLRVSECPHWDSETQTLYFSDLFAKTIHKYDYFTGKHTYVSIDPFRSGFVIPVQNRKNHFVISLIDRIGIIEWDGESDKFRIVKESPKIPIEFNDGKVDPAGRLWVGSHDIVLEDFKLSPAVGKLYSMNSKCELKQHLDGIQVSNGMTWNPITNKFYYVACVTLGIDQYDYDKTTGTISNGRQLFSLKKHNIPGIPDGINIDSDGNLWVAIFGGGRILKIDGDKPDTLLDTIIIPTIQITSMAFGGPNLDELFFTTTVVEANQCIPDEHGGVVYKITGLGVKGLPLDGFLMD